MDALPKKYDDELPTETRKKEKPEQKMDKNLLIFWACLLLLAAIWTSHPFRRTEAFLAAAIYFNTSGSRVLHAALNDFMKWKCGKDDSGIAGFSSIVHFTAWLCGFVPTIMIAGHINLERLMQPRLQCSCSYK